MNKYQQALNEMYAVLNDSERWHEKKSLLQELVDRETLPKGTINIGFIELFQRGVIDIRLRTQSEWNECMEILERETTLTWLSGRKPTEVNHWESFQEDTILICDDGVISYDYYRKPRQRIEFKKIIGEE